MQKCNSPYSLPLHWSFVLDQFDHFPLVHLDQHEERSWVINHFSSLKIWLVELQQLDFSPVLLLKSCFDFLFLHKKESKESTWDQDSNLRSSTESTLNYMNILAAREKQARVQAKREKKDAREKQEAREKQALGDKTLELQEHHKYTFLWCCWK